MSLRALSRGDLHVQVLRRLRAVNVLRRRHEASDARVFEAVHLYTLTLAECSRRRRATGGQLTLYPHLET